MAQPTLRLLMLGPPGSGKGTHGAHVAQTFGVPHISTGDLLRRQVVADTPVGRVAAVAMARGDLIPDDVVIDMVLDEVTGPSASRGYVLDGFPRTVAQAEAAYAAARRHQIELQTVIYLDVGRAELRDRILARGAADGRTDDNEETFTHRLDVYEQQTLPLLEFYDERSLVRRIDGVGSVADVAARIFDAIAADTATRHDPTSPTPQRH